MDLVSIMFNLLILLTSGVGLVIPALDYIVLKKRPAGEKLAFGCLAAGLILNLMIAAKITDKSVLHQGTIIIDRYGSFVSIIVWLGALIVAIASHNQAKDWPTAPTYYSLILIALVGVEILIYCRDLILMMVTWALVSVASYVMVGLKKDEPSVEGAVKYTLMGIAASSVMLYGLAVLYGVTSSTTPGAATLNPHLLLIGVALIVAAYSFKMGVVPFHGWLPDVYGGVYPLMISYIAGVVKIAAIMALLRIAYPYSGDLGGEWTLYLSILSVATMTFGNVTALVQKNVQRMMAYSSIAQAGYIMAAFSIAKGQPYWQIAIAGVALHVATYVLAKTGIFIWLSYLASKGIGLNLEDVAGAGLRKMPTISLAATINMLSLMGMPPLIGFWSKFIYIFLSILRTNPALALIAFANSAISVGYYAQVIKQLYFPARENPSIPYEKLPAPETVAVIITALATIILGLGTATIIAKMITPVAP